MAKINALSPGWVGGLGVVVFLVGLFFLEQAFTKKTFNFPSATSNATISSFPTDVTLSVYSSGNWDKLRNQPSIQLKDLFEQKPEKGQSRPVLINFWATWCDPCVEEIPSLNALAAQLKSQASLPVLITISVDEKQEAITKLQKTLDSPMQFPILHDPDGAFSKQLGVVKFPETFLVNSQGKILHKWIGPQDWLSLEIIQQLDFLRLAN